MNKARLALIAAVAAFAVAAPGVASAQTPQQLTAEVNSLQQQVNTKTAEVKAAEIQAHTADTRLKVLNAQIETARRQVAQAPAILRATYAVKLALLELQRPALVTAQQTATATLRAKQNELQTLTQKLADATKRLDEANKAVQLDALMMQMLRDRVALLEQEIKTKAAYVQAHPGDQQAMLELQALVNKRDQANEALTNWLSKDAQAKKTIIANLR